MQYINIKADIFSESFEKSMTIVLKMLNSPYTNTEIEALNLLKHGFEWPKIIDSFLKNSNSMKYLKGRIANSKKIFDLKNDIKELL